MTDHESTAAGTLAELPAWARGLIHDLVRRDVVSTDYLCAVRNAIQTGDTARAQDLANYVTGAEPNWVTYDEDAEVDRRLTHVVAHAIQRAAS
ncbi:hypothetical protein ACFTWF_03200 [Rhodococcus sp. NPDC056960]|uniref:hypothetical protein n=1 Tax=Rhodococcus sp. NPDC056960 TaxID=3345982 RepID=UPI0036424A10